MFGSKRTSTVSRSGNQRNRAKLPKRQILGHEQLDKRQLLTGFNAVYQYPDYVSSNAGSSYSNVGSYGSYGSSYGGLGSSLGSGFGSYGSSYGGLGSSYGNYGSSYGGLGSSLGSAFGSYGSSYGGLGSSYGGLGSSLGSAFGSYGSSYGGLGSSYGGYGSSSTGSGYSWDMPAVVTPWASDYSSSSIALGPDRGASWSGGSSWSPTNTSSYSAVMTQQQSDSWWNSLTSNLNVYGKATAEIDVGGFSKGGSASWGTNGWQINASSGYRSGGVGAGTSGVQASWSGDYNFGSVGVASASVSKSQTGGINGEMCIGVGRSQSLPTTGSNTASASAKLQICVSPKTPIKVTPAAAPRVNSSGYPVIQRSRLW